MIAKSLFRPGIIIVNSLLLFGCSPLETTQENAQTQHQMTFGNSENVEVIQNHIMMLHDIKVSKTNSGAELVGKVHTRGHQDYVRGHIDIAVVQKETGKTVSVMSTDFNNRIALQGRYNLLHPNNISTRIPGVDPDQSIFVFAYHHTNVNRLSETDCGANAAQAALDKRM